MKIGVCSKSFSKNRILREELLAKYPDCFFNEKGQEFRPQELILFLKDADMAIIGLEKINEEILQNLPKLKAISKYGVGLDSLDLNSLKKYKVKLGWTSGVNRRSVSELALGHMIACLRHLYTLNQDVKQNKWRVIQGRQLTNKTIGILGLGHIGQDLVQLLKPFECKILGNDILDKSEFANKNNVKLVDKETLFSQSDIVTIHIPLEENTRNLVSKNYLSLMKPNSILINTARGNLVDQKALHDLLVERKIGMAAFDVFDVEPPTDLDLIQCPNFFASPHIGGSSEEAVLAMGRAAILGLAQSRYV